MVNGGLGRNEPEPQEFSWADTAACHPTWLVMNSLFWGREVVTPASNGQIR